MVGVWGQQNFGFVFLVWGFYKVFIENIIKYLIKGLLVRVLVFLSYIIERVQNGYLEI